MKRSLFLLPGLLLAGAASAQDSFDFYASDIGLLQAKQIQTDVGITPAQRAKMNVAAEAHKKRLEDYQKQLQALGSVNPDRAKVNGFIQILKKDVAAVMTPPQLKRLRELSLQRLDMRALLDRKVAAKVGLSPAQSSKLKTTFDAGLAKANVARQAVLGPIVAPYQGKKPKDQAEALAWQKDVQAKLKAASAKSGPRFQAISRDTKTSMLAILTAPQKATWTALKGRPFKAK